MYIGHVNALRFLPYRCTLSGSECIIIPYFRSISWPLQTLPSIRDSYKPSIDAAEEAGASSPLLSHAEDEDDISIAPPQVFSSKQKRDFFIVLCNYGVYTTLAISYNPVLVLFLSSPTDAGGLSFSPRAVGNVMSLAGVLHATMQACFFTRAHTRWGPKKIFRISAACFVPIFVAIPIMGTLVKRAGYVTPLIWVILAIQQTACSMVAPGFSKL